MAFVSLGMLELIHSFNIKSEQSILKSEIFNNKYLIGAFILGAILQIGVVLVPKVADIFKLVPLSNVQWLYTLGISIMPIFIIEIQKKFNEIKFGKVIYNDSKMENAKKYTI
ncbi:calcium-translocating P-type ATPase PMCA-type [Clostridium sp. CAG:571]|jgi:Ca2+-transporting ATPase|nr:calcium-translocating P-type ATPase PMCA-type [Clostridium sp. CAG:571]